MSEARAIFGVPGVVGPRQAPTDYALFLRPGAPQARLHTLHDHGPLELSEHAEHLEECPARWCACVDALLVEVEVDALRLQLPEEHQELLRRPPEAIHTPSGHDVELTPGHACRSRAKPGR